MHAQVTRAAEEFLAAVFRVLPSASSDIRSARVHGTEKEEARVEEEARASSQK